MLTFSWSRTTHNHSHFQAHERFIITQIFMLTNDSQSLIFSCSRTTHNHLHFNAHERLTIAYIFMLMTDSQSLTFSYSWTTDNHSHFHVLIYVVELYASLGTYIIVNHPLYVIRVRLAMACPHHTYGDSTYNISMSLVFND